MMPLPVIVIIEHFEKLGNIPEEELLYTFDNETDIFVHDDLENDISADEVLKCIKKLKNNKSCGYDGILNKFLKNSSKLLIAVTTLFNTTTCRQVNSTRLVHWLY